ncbi:DUF4192 domain-containing protein [Nocardia sp. NPDC050799]|uniref:DUF4192 domain-containing protein n=1 Tax=Nocardia sp. NPDC050799 TaxID=3154842 RepID=UPI0033C7BCAC
MVDKNRSAATAPDHPVRIDNPGQLIASVPAILGFVPHRSLVVALLSLEPSRRAGAIKAVVRCDLHDPHDMAGAVASAAIANGADAVLVFVIDDRRPPLHPDDAVLIAVNDRLAESGVEVKGAWTVQRIATEQRWHSLRPPHRTGVLPDPTTTVIAAYRAYRGGSVAPDRTALEDLFTPLPELAQEISEHLPDAETRLHPGDAGTREYLWIQTVLCTVAAVDAGADAAPQALADVAVAWRDNPARDAALALAGTAHADAAEQVALTLTRTQSGQDRARAASVLAFLTYHRGEGALAGMAVEAALTADPYDSLAALLRTALDCGLPTDRVRSLAQHIRQVLVADGVEIPPVVLPDLP